MYYDIIQKESVDERGIKTIELVPVTTAPVYDDIAPKDMSLENQLKAGVKLEKVSGKSKPSLESSDKAESSIYQNSQNIEFIEHVSESPETESPDSQPKQE